MRNLARSALVASIAVVVTGLGPVRVADAVPPGAGMGGATTQGWLCRLTRLC